MRYLRLYLHFLRFSFTRALEFRLDFGFRIGMDVVFYAVNLMFFGVLFQHTTDLGSWNLDQVTIFVCGFLWIDSVHMTVFANNMWWLPIFINRGDLDYYLVRPVSPLFFLSVRDFAANSFVNALLASGLLAWSLLRYPEPLAFGSVAAFLALLSLGVLLHWAIRMAFILPVFWIHSSRGLDDINWQVEKLSERPHQLYPVVLRVLLTTVVPLALFASVPAHVLFDGLDAAVAGRIALGSCVAFGVLAFIWRRALGAYSSASS